MHMGEEWEKRRKLSGLSALLKNYPNFTGNFAGRSGGLA